MSSGEWTIDGIAHALGVPEQRMRFLRDINLTPLADLPTVLDRWVRHVTALEAAKPGIDALRARVAAGEALPAEMEHSEESAAAFERLRAQSQQSRGAA
ncbi:hypothetical protein [Streptomyces sp. bgisy060]|uniref:hypothetical protein n=1 Tax=Streptomyces sp. bgisy060 TaxID=3413775 RepID=UPI003EBF56A6